MSDTPDNLTTAPLHERLTALLMRDSTGREITPVFVPAALLREAAAVLRPPEGEVAQVIAWLQHEYDECMEEGLLEEEPDEIRAYVENVRAALAHLRRFGRVEAERDALREALRELLEHSGVTDVGDEDKFPEDIAAESKARRALAPAPAAEGE